MVWQKKLLGEVSQIYSGFAFRSQDLGMKGIPVLKIANIQNKLVVPQCADHFPEELLTDRLKRYFLHSDDTLVAMTGAGSVGKVGKMPAVEGKYLVNQRVGIVRPDRSMCDPSFIYYCLSQDFYETKLYALGLGAGQPNVSGKQIAELEILSPPIPVQQRIASILAAYDELIENSQRRIRILEAMARGLYREWFVHFRFPGHENHPRVASALGEIPEGWVVKSVADAFVISGGGTPSRKEDSFWQGGSIQWYSPTDLTKAGSMFIDDSSDHITAIGLAQSSARLFPARSVMLTSRATIGAIAINTHEACTNQGFITCLPNDRVPLYFLFQWLTENVPTFQRMASGATFKEISRGVFKTIEFLQPPQALADQFEAVAAPMAEQVLALQRQIQNLRRTRDLLLPRLLSGQINVEAP